MLTKTNLLNTVRGALFQNRLMEEALRHLTRGREPSHWVSRLVPNHYQYSRPSPRMVGQKNGSVELDLSDFMEWHLYYDFVNDSVENLRPLCKPGDVVFDVGANIGAILVKLAEHVGQGGRVIGFEPDPGRYSKCREYIRTNLVTNAELFPVALGDQEGTGKIRIRNPLNQGMNQIVPDSVDDGEGADIRIVSLDRFVSEKSIDRIDLIKIDVEGYEAQVLKGAEMVLKKYRPTLYVEIDQRNLIQHNAQAQEIFDRLHQYGYRLFRERASTPLGVVRPDEHFDLLALPG